MRQLLIHGSFGLWAALLLGPACANAALAWEDHARIRQTAEAYAVDVAAGLAPAGAAVSVTATSLDSRLRLPACSIAPTAFGMAGQRGIPSSVGVRCEGAKPWSIYVPVRVEVIADVVVLTGVAERGAPLGAAALKLEPREVSGLVQGYLTDLAATENMVLKRQMPPGTVLNPSLLAPERVVLRGERVRIRAGGGPIAISVEGEALADAALGERVRVRNIASGNIVEGVVAEAGVVLMRR